MHSFGKASRNVRSSWFCSYRCCRVSLATYRLSIRAVLNFARGEERRKKRKEEEEERRGEEEEERRGGGREKRGGGREKRGGGREEEEAASNVGQRE